MNINQIRLINNWLIRRFRSNATVMTVIRVTVPMPTSMTV